MTTRRQRAAMAAERANGSLTERAKTSFDYLMQRAWRSALVPEGESVEVEKLAALPVKMKERDVVVLTISSYAMRVVVAQYYKRDAATRAHFERLNRAEPGSWDDQAFTDALAESGNICVGALNRWLGSAFQHIGMSTPNLLSRDAMAYVESLGKGYSSHFEMQGLSQPYYASLYVIAYDGIDFAADIEAEAEVADTGELEMF